MEVRAPAAGRVVDLAEVPDPVFAAAMVGPGLALEPRTGGATGVLAARAPVAGNLKVAHPHAFVVQAPGGAVMVHLGIDTISLHGDGFEMLVPKGEDVAAGDDVVRWDPDAVAAAGLAPLVVVIALGAKAGDLEIAAPAGTDVLPGDVLFRWT